MNSYSQKSKYEVAFSFAGEDRQLVDQIAGCLTKHDVSIFYDQYEEIDIWGKNLYTHLDNIYRNETRYCVMIISKHYKNKLWTNHERESAQARALISKEEYILPIKLDDTNIPGVLPTISYINGIGKTPQQLCEVILQKIRKLISTESTSSDIRIPRIPRKFSPVEKKKFLVESFHIIQNYFEHAIRQVALKYDYVQGNFSQKRGEKFTASFHIENELKIACKIWIPERMHHENTIVYYENYRTIDLDNNTMNDYATVEDDGFILYYKIGQLGFGYNSGHNIEVNKASAQDVAKYFWNRFIKNLES